jgi:hypothetical protein
VTVTGPWLHGATEGDIRGAHPNRVRTSSAGLESDPGRSQQSFASGMYRVGTLSRETTGSALAQTVAQRRAAAPA